MFQIALDPSLNLSADQFATAWNADPEARAKGEAKTDLGSPKGFLDPTLATLLIGAAVGVTVNVLSAAIYDFLKTRLSPDQKPVVVVQHINGEETIIVYLERP
jgi:hypothetical protein